MERIAAADLAALGERRSVKDMVRAVVVGTPFGDTLLAALRRLIQEDASARLYSTSPGSHAIP